MESNSSPAPQGCHLQRCPGLILVNNTPKGRGVFASGTIPKGTIIDVSPVLLFTPEEVEHHTSQTCLQHYTYYWPSSDGKTQTQALALGLGSMFNHSTLRQNIVWTRDLDAQTIVYTAHCDISAGEELCISYGNGRLWFKDADLEAETDEFRGDEDEIVRSGLSGISIVSSGEGS